MAMRRIVLVVLGLGVLSVWGLTPGLADGGGGGVFVDVPTSHPAYTAIRDLVQRGIIVIGAGGEFQGNQPLLRYDAAQWLYRAVKNVEGTRPTADLAAQISALDARLKTVSADVARQGTDVQGLRTEVASVRQGLQAVQGQAGGEVARQAQLGFVLGVTGVVLSLAAVAIALFW